MKNNLSAPLSISKSSCGSGIIAHQQSSKPSCSNVSMLARANPVPHLAFSWLKTPDQTGHWKILSRLSSSVLSSPVLTQRASEGGTRSPICVVQSWEPLALAISTTARAVMDITATSNNRMREEDCCINSGWKFVRLREHCWQRTRSIYF